MVQSPCRTGIREQAYPRTGKTEPRQAEADRDVHVCGETPDRLFRRTSQLELEYVDVARSFYDGIGTSLGRTYLGLGELPSSLNTM